MPEPSRVIVTSALTGAIHTPWMSPHLPVTPDRIAAEGYADEAGAAILHAHARVLETGRSDESFEAFARFVPPL